MRLVEEAGEVAAHTGRSEYLARQRPFRTMMPFE